MEKPIFNFVVMVYAALTPMILGAIWFNPKVFGKAWMSSAGLTAEKVKGANVFLILGIGYLFSLFLAMSLTGIVFHQNGVFSMFEGSENAAALQSTLDFLNKDVTAWSSNFRTFKHGALHGFITSVFIALPIIGITALSELKSFKYIIIHWGYWAITLLIMGGILCQFS